MQYCEWNPPRRPFCRDCTHPTLPVRTIVFCGKRREPDVVFVPIYRTQVNADCSAGEPRRATGSCPQDCTYGERDQATWDIFEYILKVKKVITAFPLKYFFHFILVRNSQIHFALLWIMAFKDPRNSKMEHIWGCLLWGRNMKRHRKLLKWKTRGENKNLCRSKCISCPFFFPKKQTSWNFFSVSFRFPLVSMR